MGLDQVYYDYPMGKTEAVSIAPRAAGLRALRVTRASLARRCCSERRRRTRVTALLAHGRGAAPWLRAHQRWAPAPSTRCTSHVACANNSVIQDSVPV